MRAERELKEAELYELVILLYLQIHEHLMNLPVYTHPINSSEVESIFYTDTLPSFLHLIL